jgi:hypothetical protein
MPNPTPSAKSHSESNQKSPDLILLLDSSLDNQSLEVPMSTLPLLDEVVSLQLIPSTRELRNSSLPFPSPSSIITPQSPILLPIQMFKFNIPLPIIIYNLPHRSNMVQSDNDLVLIDIGTGVRVITIQDPLNSMDRVRRRDHGWVEAGSQARMKDIIVFMYIEVEVI